MIHNHWLSITHHGESWCIILSHWLWIILCYSEAVVVNHGELCWASGCESWCVILSQWLLIMFTMTHNHSDQYITPWFTTTGSVWHTMIHNHWLSITRHNSQPLAQHYNPWLATCHTEPVVVNHGVIYWSEWLWVMVCNAETVIVNHGVLFWAIGCESYCVILRQWLSITPHDSQPLAQHYTPWFTTTGSA
jgi:hypothetical protein